ncbi:MAG: alpha-galactosidase [Solobacterium sp.]|nr:alpha-galactosidase [Solobacterium sp.]
MPELRWTVKVLENGADREYKGSYDLVYGENHVTCDLDPCMILSVKGTVLLTVSEEERIFMNGYQTWTFCPEYSIHSRIRGTRQLPKIAVDKFSLDRYGDYHFVDYPYQRGITHGFSYCYFRKDNYYRLFASLNEEPGYTRFRYNAKTSTMTITRDCASLKTSGTYPIFDLYLAQGSENEVFDGWFDALPMKRREAPKLYGYSSWYNRYQDISEESIQTDLEGCRKIFEPGDLFQIDDGWEMKVGDWMFADYHKFPGGMKPMVDKIHESGFKAGLWLAPFVAETDSELFHFHPDWFLKVNGEPWINGCNWSGFYSLDIDHPEVKNYLRKVFHKVFDVWGFDLVKLDFLYAAAPFGNDHETRAGRMIRAMEFLRELCGDHPILGCGVPVMPAFGLVEYCRISCDVTLDWNDRLHMRVIHRERPSTRQAIGNTVFRRQLNNRAYISDPDVFFLREDNLKLNDLRKEILITIGALLGGVFLTSDDPSSYTEEMKEKYRKYRKLTDAELLSVYHDRRRITITYRLDGKTDSVTFGKE